MPRKKEIIPPPTVIRDYIIQPLNCSCCKSQFIEQPRVLSCGCATCTVCSEKYKLKNTLSCPTCDNDQDIAPTDRPWDFFHDQVTEKDIRAQQARNQFFRNELWELDQQIASIPEANLLDDDETDELAQPSDSSIAITSSDDDDYTCTQYAIQAQRLEKLRNKIKQKERRKKDKMERTSDLAPQEPGSIAEKRIIQKKERLSAKMLLLAKERRYRLMAQHGIGLYQPPPPPKKKKKKKEKKGSDEEEEEEEEEDEENKKKPKKPKVDPNLKPMTKRARWQRKIANWLQKVKVYERRKARLQARLDSLSDDPTGNAAAAVVAADVKTSLQDATAKKNILQRRLEYLDQEHKLIWSRVDQRIEYLESPPVENISYAKLQRNKDLLAMLRAAFYAPATPEKANGEEDDEDDY